MPLLDAFDCSIKYTQVIDENGKVDAALFPKDLDDETVKQMYIYMCFARALDAKTLSLQRQGRAATFAPLLGEEATQIGVAFGMAKGDILVPSFRQHGILLARGMRLDSYFIYWRGFEEGNDTLKDIGSFPVAVPVGTQMPHGAGAAFAQKYLNTGKAVFAFVGDGGTSEGDFYEAINFAGAFGLPLVSVVENNQWAISLPRSKQTAAKTLAQKGIAAGINSVQVDGNDVVAVYKATKEAAALAREGKPSLIECVTYRISMHTTSDDPTKYRSDAEVEAWKAKDPISRIRKYLEGKSLWNDSMEKEMADKQSSEIDEAVAKAEAFKPDPKSMFESVYSFLPQTLKEEEDSALASGFWM